MILDGFGIMCKTNLRVDQRLGSFVCSSKKNILPICYFLLAFVLLTGKAMAAATGQKQ